MFYGLAIVFVNNKVETRHMTDETKIEIKIKHIIRP